MITVGVVSAGGVKTTLQIADPVVAAQPPAQQQVSVLPPTLKPVVAVDTDTAAVELGMRFRSSTSTKVLGVKFYKGGAANSGPHVGSLWSGDGTRLAQATFTGESASGWQSVLFTTPVDIVGGVDYVVSYLAPKGGYSASNGGFGTPVTSGQLSADIGAGTYRYSGGFPEGRWQNSNYFVDVIAAEGGTAPPVVIPPPPRTGSLWAKWSNGPSTDETWWPIGVWQCYNLHTVIKPFENLGHAVADTGVNMLLGTWSWLDPDHGPLIVANARKYGLTMFASGPSTNWLTQHPADKDVIRAWLLGDEFDMYRHNKNDANSANTIYARYQSAIQADPSRPIHINYGKAYGCWQTRTFGMDGTGGWDTGSEVGDLKLYMKACDSASVDTYWWTDTWEPAHKGAYLYGENIDNMRIFAASATQPIMGFVENSRITPEAKAITPDQLESAVWSQIVHGANGMVYFIHDFGAATGGDIGIWSTAYFNRASGDAIHTRMKTVNARIKGLAPVLNSPQLGAVNTTTGRISVAAYVTVASTNSIPVDVMVRDYGGKRYIFAQASGNNTKQGSGATTATFTLPAGGQTVSVRDENRTVNITDGKFSDSFTPYQLHIYVIG